MIWNSEDAMVFVRVVRADSFSQAARELDKPKSRISRCIARLESVLGTRLFDRNTRSIRLTHEGELLYRQLSGVHDQFVAALDEVQGQANEPQGPLTVAVPMAFGREVLAPRLSQFLNDHPKIELDLRLQSQPVDIIGSGYDLSIEVGPSVSSELIATTICPVELIWTSHPRFAPMGLAELCAECRVIERRYARTTLFATRGLQRQNLVIEGCSQVNDPMMARQLALDGMGPVLLPSLYCTGLIADGALIRHVPDWDIGPQPKLNALYPSRRYMNSKTQAFIAFAQAAASNAYNG